MTNLPKTAAPPAPERYHMITIHTATITSSEHGAVSATVASSAGPLGVTVSIQHDGTYAPAGDHLDAWADDATQAALSGLSDYDRDVMIGELVIAVTAALAA